MKGQVAMEGHKNMQKPRVPGALLTLALVVAIYSQWTDGGIWRTTAVVCAALLVVGYVLHMLRSRQKTDR
jgi:hypothetical protein